MSTDTTNITQQTHCYTSVIERRIITTCKLHINIIYTVLGLEPMHAGSYYLLPVRFTDIVLFYNIYWRLVLAGELFIKNRSGIGWGGGFDLYCYIISQNPSTQKNINVVFNLVTGTIKIYRFLFFCP